MLKKILCFIIAVIMLAGMFSLMAFAQVTEVKESPSYFEKLPKWKISPSVPGTTCGLPGGDDADIIDPDYDTSDWIDAVAPSTVLGNLLDAGVYDDFFMARSGNTDPYYNRQFTSIPSSDFAERWWYSTDITLPASEDGKKITLTVGGMSYEGDLYINGQRVYNEYNYTTEKEELWNTPPVYPAVADSNTNTGSAWAGKWGTQDLDAYKNIIVGSFRRFDIDITDYVTADGVTKNNIKFKILKPQGSNDFTYHWVDWHPRPVDSMMGLTGEVSVSSSGSVRLNNPALTAKVAEDLSTANINLYCDATNLTDFNVTGTARAIVKDPAGATVATVSKSVTIPSKVYNYEVAFKSEDFAALKLNNPQLWWPYMSGGQPMYTVEWSFTYVGAVSDRLTHRAGIREITTDITVGPIANSNASTVSSSSGANQMQVYVNHKPITMRGGGYCPTDLFLRHDLAKNQGVIDNMKAMGLNMMRDEGKFFDNDLLDLCDENGILVMSGWCCCDRHQSPNAWSKCERFIGYEEQWAQIKNLRGHASAALWYNGSDQPASFSQSTGPANSWMVEEMYHMIEAKSRWDECGVTATSGCLDTSKLLGNINSGHHMDASYDNQSPTYMYNPAVTRGWWGFVSEGVGGAGIPSIETMKKIIPDANLYPYNNSTNYAPWNLHATTSGFTTFAPLVSIMENAYGASSDLESWHAKADAFLYDQQRAQYESLDYHKYTNKTGLVNWMLNSARPSMYWQLFDWYMNPTSSTYGVAKANEPVHIMYNLFDHDISVINNTFDAYDDMTATMKIYNLDGKLISTPLETKLDVAPDGVGEVKPYGTMTITPKRNGFHYNEKTGEFTPMTYDYNGQITEAYGVNKIWNYDDIEASFTEPASDVYFIRLELKDSTGEVVSYNSYAVSLRTDVAQYGSWNRAPALQSSDFTALNSLPSLSAAELKCVQTSSATTNGIVVQTLEVTNNSNNVAHNVSLSAYTDNTCKDLIGSCQYSDNLFILFPHETRTITVTHRTSNFAGDAVITVTCYNNQIGGDKPIRYQNVYTGIDVGGFRSLSVNKPVTGSGGGTASNLTTVTATHSNLAVAGKTFMDSNTNTVYSPTVTGGSAWFYVDLGAKKSFDQVMLRFNGSNNLRGRPDNIVIHGSDDASTWTELATFDNSTSSSIMANIILPKTEAYRYVRATLTGAVSGQTTFNVSGFDIYAFNKYMNVSVVGDGTVTCGGKTITQNSYVNQSVIALENGGAQLTLTPDAANAGVAVYLDDVDVTSQLVGNVLTLAGLTDDAKLTVYFGASVDIRARDSFVGTKSPVEYTVSLTNLKDANLVTLSFTANAEYLNLNSYTALNGFTILNQVEVEDLGNNMLKMTLKLMYPSGFASNTGQLDILKITGKTLDAVGDMTVSLAEVSLVGKGDSGNADYLPCIINTADAKTQVTFREPLFNKYDLNRDGKVDDIDLSIAVFFYLWDNRNADWETPLYNSCSAKKADVTGDNLVDMADLIEIMANYCESYELYPN